MATTRPPRRRRRSGGGWSRRLAFALIAWAWLGGAAAADITVGVFAPAAPLPNTQARVELANHLASHLQSQLDQRVKGRVFVRDADFRKAVQDKQLGIALVDTTYLIKSNLGHRVVAASPVLRWRLVAAVGLDLLALKGARLTLATGGHEAEIANGLFHGEASRFFESISAAPDSASALAVLALDKADCVLLPMAEGGGSLPEGFTEIKALQAMPALMLVVYPEVLSEQLQDRVALAVRSFHEDALVSTLRPAGDEALASVASALAVSERRGPMVTLPLRLLIADLVSPVRFAIPQRSPLAFVIQAGAATTERAPPAKLEASTSPPPSTPPAGTSPARPRMLPSRPLSSPAPRAAPSPRSRR